LHEKSTSQDFVREYYVFDLCNVLILWYFIWYHFLLHDALQNTIFEFRIVRKAG